MGMKSGRRLPSSTKKAKKTTGAKKAAATKRKATKKKTATAKKKAVKAKKAAKTKRATTKRKGTSAKRTGATKRKSTARKPSVKKKSSAPRRAAAPAKDPNQALRDLAKRIVAVTEVNDDEAAFALYANNVESTEVGTPTTKGLTALREKFAMWREMVRDARFVPRNVWVDANTIVIEWDGTAKLRANGQEVQLHEIAIHEIKGGKIRRERFFYDPAALRPDEPKAAPEIVQDPPRVSPPLFPLSEPDQKPREPGFAWSSDDPDDPEGF